MAPPSGGAQFRFLIDDEVIDSDIPAIENLARSLGKSSDDLISDRDGDGFLDLPPGAEVELPTGQVGDEGLFDVTSYGDVFPFRSEGPYTRTDFLAEGTALERRLGTQDLQNETWRGSDAPHPDLIGNKVLDPVLGIEMMNNGPTILALPNASVTHVSPVFKSDVSMVERSSSKYGSPAANLLGERRGLLAFKIVGAQSNPAGGSYLPLITIEVVDPAEVDLGNIGSGGSSDSSAVRLVK